MTQRRSSRRAVHGMLLLDKPTGLTSNRALQIVKRLFQARKAGHTGSLDPLATGLLPLCFGEATKLSGYLLDADKRYRVTCRLGSRTDTADAEGQVVATAAVPALDRHAVESVLSGFLGEQDQVPPMYSALKQGGRRLYEMAREGIEVERKPRRIVIHDLALLGVSGDALELNVACSKGTYIRTLVEDIARALGTEGHVAALRRTGAGPYGEDQMISLAELEAAAEQGGAEALDRFLRPLDSALGHWPAVNLTPDTAYYLRRGQAVMVPRAPAGGWVRVYEGERDFLGLGEILDDGRVAPRRLMNREAAVLR
ncbi:MAG: tRNA pseudouridine(55) synthase TruB [Gammaproteobacteria bacterium]